MHRALAAVASTALLFASCAVPPLERTWLLVEAPAYRLVTDLSRDEAVDLADHLDLYLAVIAAVTNTTARAPRVPLTIVAFARGGGYERTTGERDASGFATSQSLWNRIAFRADARGQAARETLLHEYTHVVTSQENAVLYPPWFTEGFAELLSTMVVEGDSVRIGRPPALASSNSALGRSSVRRVLAAERDRDRGGAARFYARAWLLTHYLMIGEPYAAQREARSVPFRMDEYLARMTAGEPSGSAFAAAFELDLDALEGAIDRYFDEGRIDVLTLESAAFEPAAPAAREVRVLTHAEAANELGWLAVVSERLEVARGYFASGAERDPGHARLQAGLGTIASNERRWEDADAHFARALALAPDDAESRVDFAAALLLAARERPDARERLVARARAELARAIQLAPDEPAAHAYVGVSYLVGGGDPAAALAAARRAERLLPAAPGLQVIVARLCIATGDLDEARRIARRLATMLHADRELEALRTELEAAERRAQAGSGAR